jgi:uncharacterized Fe-S center protein
VEVKNPEGRAFKRFSLARRVVDADVLISLPKFKTHGLTLFTGGVKNLFGCLPGLQKAEMHLRAPKSEAFSQMLVDLLVAVRPGLTIMDAIVGMEGNGPSNGAPRKIGAVLASTDPVAVDCVACQIVGVAPMDVATTRLATAQGKGEGDPRHIEVAGDRIERMRIDGFRLPSGHGGIWRTARLTSFLQSRLVAKPAVVAELCRGCWTCEEHCPAAAISRNGRLPAFDYGKCIRCYCCQEMCLHDAIALRRPLLPRLLAR